MLELAQKTADEHVNAAKAEAERILADARATHQRTMGDLESERASMQAKVDELRSFEKEYRTRLRSYLEGQLRDLDAKAATPPGPASATPAVAPVAPQAPQAPAPQATAPQAPPSAPPVSGVPQPVTQGGPPSSPRPQAPRPFSPAPAPDAPSGPPVQAD